MMNGESRGFSGKHLMCPASLPEDSKGIRSVRLCFSFNNI